MVTRGATGWQLPALVLVGGLLVGGLLILYGGLHAEPASATRPALATVVDSTPCGPPDARDTVRVEVDGRSEQLPLDGCGNPVGVELQVELGAGGEQLVRIAGTGPSPHGDLVDRLSALLLVLAGLAGALLTLLVGPRRVS